MLVLCVAFLLFMLCCVRYDWLNSVHVTLTACTVCSLSFVHVLSCEI